MTSEALQELHDKLTRGLPLSADEQASLDSWYAQQDDEERALLTGAPVPNVLSALHAQVQAVNAELHTVTQHIQEVTNENAILRDEIRKLQEQVARRSKARPA